MVSVVDKLLNKEKINPPTFLGNNVHYEAMMGSVAYGCSNDTSDVDVYGFCIPPKSVIFPHLDGYIEGFSKKINRFDQFQQHHVKDNDKEYDLNIYNIVKYFRLCMDNNPNMIDSLFVPRRCILHSTSIGEHLREHRHLFLHKGSWHKFKGYSYSQLNKCANKAIQEWINYCNKRNFSYYSTLDELKNNNLFKDAEEEFHIEGLLKKVYQSGNVTNRIESIAKHGYDCYDGATTEFLTDTGWKFYDEISHSNKLATVEVDSGNIEYQTYTGYTDKIYTGNMYVIEPYNSKCIVTEGHNMLVSPAHRSPKNNYSTEYDETISNWNLIKVKDILENKRSHYHVRLAAKCVRKDLSVDDTYLQLAGLFLSDGTVNFRDGKVKSIRFTQSKPNNGFYSLIQSLMSTYEIKEYPYKKEMTWVLHGEIARKIYEDFGHKKAKALPKWCFSLSTRQAILFFESLMLGDGYNKEKCLIYYTSIEKLADDIQAMLTSSGILATVSGPYLSKTSFGDGLQYHIYVSKVRSSEHCINFNRLLKDGEIAKGKEGYPVKEIFVKNNRVVCFEVPNGTLITRNSGKVSIHGNCKFAYHIVRLLSECEQILMEGDLDLERNREQLKSIRRGDWSLEEIEEWFSQKEKDLESLYVKSDLRYSPDEEKIKNLLIDCLEMHYDNIDDCVNKPDKYREAVNQIKEIINKI